MPIETRPVAFEIIKTMRDMYRHDMNCQIIHDSIHARPGWTREYAFFDRDAPVGYGSVAVGGPWKDKPTVYEYYLLPQYRLRTFDLFDNLLASSGAVMIETQSNDPLLTAMLHAFAQPVISESILFEDGVTTSHAPPGAVFRRAGPDDAAHMAQRELDAEAKWLVVVEDAIAGAGDILYHYNRPYGDIYMKVAEPFRKRGIGAYLVQELKRVCYEGGSVPAARCNPKNIASRKTLQKAGFVPCAHILNGSI